MKKKIKVYSPTFINPILNSSHAHLLPFDLEPEKFQLSDNLKDCKIVAVLGGSGENIEEQKAFLKQQGYQNQVLVVLNLYHVDDGSDLKEIHDSQKLAWEDFADKVVILHTNMLEVSCPRYDILWNRQKAYFTEYDKFDLTSRTWTWGASKDMYKLTPITEKINPKHYLSPNRIYYQAPDHPRVKARIKLKDFLSNYDSKGYKSDPSNGEVLYSEQSSADFNKSLKNGGGTWWPVANTFYDSSVASIYVETITEDFKTKTITEKTWDPLIKGHFIIPFSYSGIIEDLKDYGFIFPEWIDYSYDKVADYKRRFSLYLNSVEQYLSLSDSDLERLHKENISILEHNRNVFFTRPYDSLFKKLKPYIKS